MFLVHWESFWKLVCIKTFVVIETWAPCFTIYYKMVWFQNLDYCAHSLYKFMFFKCIESSIDGSYCQTGSGSNGFWQYICRHAVVVGSK